MIVHLNNEFVRITERDLKGFAPGYLNGLGVFETLLCEQGRAFFLQEHYRRFLYGCDRYILPSPMPLKAVREVLGRLLKLNQLKNARVRLMAWRKGCDTHSAVMAIPREPFSRAVYHRGFSACVYPGKLDRSPELVKIKTLDYGVFLRAYEHAIRNRHQEAIFLNSSGEIVEGSRSNIFIVKGKKLLTPHLNCGCLAGVTRQAVLNAARKLGLKTSAGHLFINDLRCSDEAFLTNALVGIMPLTGFQGHRIANGRPGAVTARLSKSYKKLSQRHGVFLL